VLIVLALVVVAAVGGITWAAMRDDDPSAPSAGGQSGPILGPVSNAGIAEVGDQAPDFQLATLDGATVRLSDLRGTPVVLNFWASWCEPCRAEFPLIRKNHAAAGDAFALVGVDTDDIRSDGRRFATDERARWPNGFDADGAVAKAYGVIGKPQTFFIGADGTIAARVPAELTQHVIDEKLALITIRERKGS